MTSPDALQDTNQLEIKAAKTMLLVIGTFIIFWIPLMINFSFKLIVNYTSFTSVIENDEVLSHLVDFLCYSAIHLSPAMNPLIYAFRMKDVRDAVKKLFSCLNQNVVKSIQY